MNEIKIDLCPKHQIKAHRIRENERIANSQRAIDIGLGPQDLLIKIAVMSDFGQEVQNCPECMEIIKPPECLRCHGKNVIDPKTRGENHCKWPYYCPDCFVYFNNNTWVNARLVWERQDEPFLRRGGG